MARVLVSAAHTMENPGEIYQDLREADLTRKILKKVLPYLEQYKLDYQAVPLDLPLLQRIEWINNTGYTEENGDIFVEIHINDGGKRGIEGWYKGAADPSNKSQKLAEAIVGGISKYTGYQAQGAKSEYEHELQSLLILNQTNPIGTAVETLYIDNPEDIAILKDEAKLDGLAKAIADSINDYVKGTPATLPAAAIAPTSIIPSPTANPSTSQPTIQPATTVPTQPAASATLPVAPIPSPQPLPSPSPLPAPAPFPPNPFGSAFGGGKPFGANPFGSNPLGGGMPGSAGSSSTKPLVMDREERKKMIQDTYKKILGKEASQSDLNYYLNLGTNEDDLIKKLLEGPDHEKMVKDATEATKLRTDFQKLESEVTQLKAANNDLKAMHDTLNKLLEHKNTLIAKFQHELVSRNILAPGQHVDTLQQRPVGQSINSQPKAKPKKTFMQGLMKALGI